MSQKNFHSSIDATPFFTFLPIMTTSSNASPTAVAHRDAVISAFNNYKYSRDSKDPSDALFLLSLAAKYCVHVPYSSYLFLFSRKIDARARRISLTWRILSYLHINQCTMFFSSSRTSTTPLLKQHPAWSLPQATKLSPTSAISPCRYCRGNGQSESQDIFISYSYIFLTLLTQHGYILKQCPRKIVRSKAIVKDKDDEVKIVVGHVDIDYMMGGCNGPNATSGADTMRL